MHLYSIHIDTYIYIYIYIYIYMYVHTLHHYLPVASAMDVEVKLALKVRQTPASVRVNWKSS